MLALPTFFGGIHYICKNLIFFYDFICYFFKLDVH